ncbi:MAG: endonuclease/exonuclease/phosphatase family protein [Phycisphaerae bacterium]|nr:endonuclease/exonuclease/phosphatase family protein [Phycisphaerae bacterium]
MNKTVSVMLAIVFILIAGVCPAGQKAVDSKAVDSYAGQDIRGVVKAMTFNVRVDTFLDVFGHGWGGRKKIAADTITRNAPDVVGLQEALNKQVRYLDSALPQYSCYTAGRSNGKTKGESCAILYRKDRFQLIDSGTFWFSNKPSRPGSKGWGNIPPRICSWVYLTEKDSTDGLYVYNVHLDNLSQKSRAKSVELLAKMIGERKTDDPFIVMGDFNMEIDNPAMEFLCQYGCNTSYPKMFDAFESIHPGQTDGTGTRHGFNGTVNGPRIDHMPVCASAKVLDVKIDRYNVKGKYPSDHFPVVATIAFDSKGSEATTYLTQESTNKVKAIH